MKPRVELISTAAYDELVAVHMEAGYRVALAILRDPDEARDAVQDAAFKAWRRFDQLRDGRSARAWFLSIVANQCRTVSKSRWWSVLKVDPPEAQGRSVDIAAAVDLRRALRRLGHDERLVLVLRYYLDMPFEEIATTLGITTKAARNRVERAVRRLRPIIQNQGAAV